MSRELEISNAQPVQSLDDLLQIFQKGSRKPAEFKIGMEYERFLVSQKSEEPISFQGEKGIEKFLTELAKEDEWEKVFDQGNLIQLRKDQTAITLEPGGQVEISCQAHASMNALYEDFSAILKQMNVAAKSIDGKWIERGIHPTQNIDNGVWMPKSRYRWMKDYYSKRSRAALEMMILTASIQINFDYFDEQDAKKKVLVSSFLSPVLGAVFANSCFEHGHLNGFATRRIPIWEKTDPDRCGIPLFFVDGSFSFERYRDYALDIPMYFAFRKGQYVDVGRQTFREFLQSKKKDLGPVTLDDWEFHLTTLFPEVRLKNHLEFRTIDSNSFDHLMSAATFWKGLFHNPKLVDKWYEFFKPFTYDQLQESLKIVSRLGLQAKLGSFPVLDLALQLWQDAFISLSQNFNSNELEFLQPMKEILDTKMSPAEKMIKDLKNGKSLDL